jgi:hypothetical protein
VYGANAPENRLAKTGAHCHLYHAVDLFFSLQAQSPENGSFPGFGWRLSGIFGRKSANAGLQRLSTIRKARIWRAFLVKKRKFSQNRTGWLGREGSNLRMAESKSGRIAININARSEF